MAPQTSLDIAFGPLSEMLGNPLDYMIPQTFTVTSEHIRFYFFSFSVFTLFSYRFRAVGLD